MQFNILALHLEIFLKFRVHFDIEDISKMMATVEDRKPNDIKVVASQVPGNMEHEDHVWNQKMAQIAAAMGGILQVCSTTSLWDKVTEVWPDVPDYKEKSTLLGAGSGQCCTRYWRSCSYSPERQQHFLWNDLVFCPRSSQLHSTRSVSLVQLFLQPILQTTMKAFYQLQSTIDETAKRDLAIAINTNEFTTAIMLAWTTMTTASATTKANWK